MNKDFFHEYYALTLIFLFCFARRLEDVVENGTTVETSDDEFVKVQERLRPLTAVIWNMNVFVQPSFMRLPPLNVRF